MYYRLLAEDGGFTVNGALESAKFNIFGLEVSLSETVVVQ